MASICLTVYQTSAGGTWTGHPSCPGIVHTYGTSCTGDIESFGIGNIFPRISLTATPDSGYTVVGWNVTTQTGIPLVVTYTGNPNTSEVASFTPTEAHGDITITMSFVPLPCELTVSVGINHSEGCVRLLSPDNKRADCFYNDTFTIDPSIGDTTDITVQAEPNDGYVVIAWLLDGVGYGSSNIPPSFSTIGYTSRWIEVVFGLDTGCTKDKELEITISGSGSVTVPDGLYCSTDVLNISPIPSNGWVFYRWEYGSSSGITELSGNVLRVEMTTNRTNITAIFEELVVEIGEPVENLSMFYCPSENYKDNIVSFSFSNQEESPSAIGNYHFRLNFYADVIKQRLIYSAFSMSDNKRWFVDDGAFSQLSSDGVDVSAPESVRIIYDPEVIPQQITENQKPHFVNNSDIVYEDPLICGVNYYVEVQAYETSTNTITDIETISISLDCNRVESYYWNYNKDENNWLCSGQGKTDLKVCGGFDQSINSSISSNLFGVFKVVWQGRKSNNTNNIYSGLWDSEKDVLYSSGQGFYDVLELTDANDPVVITDPALNFYITGTTSDNIKYKACALGSCEEGSAFDGGSQSKFEEFCFPGSAAYLDSSYDQIKMRVYKEDISGSLVINDEKVVPVVDKKSIKLDIDGIAGSYAVRLKNIEDSNWGEWINIDNNLSGGEEGDNLSYDAYRIDGNRFLVNWDIERNNGLRRICCQVLTMYGISNVFCIEVLANLKVSQHRFKFYTDEARSNEFSTYNGQYVLSLEADGVSVDSSGKATVYFDAIFSDPMYHFAEAKFNVIQQGVNDLRNQEFDSVSESKLSGQFIINPNDGVFNKDGAAFIEIITPSLSDNCESDERDKYNVINSDDEEIFNINLLPEEIYQEYQRSQLSKALDINKFKQHYDKDDTNFKFGDPGYYRE